MQNPDYEKRISDLEQIILALQSSNSVPREIETSLRDRLGDIQIPNTTVLTTAIGGTVGFNLPNTSGVIPITIKGKTYNVLYQ